MADPGPKSFSAVQGRNRDQCLYRTPPEIIPACFGSLTIPGTLPRPRAAESVGNDVSCRGSPWISIPPEDLNYYYSDGKIYFHCGLKGKKLVCMKANPQVCFTVARQLAEVREHEVETHAMWIATVSSLLRQGAND